MGLAGCGLPSHHATGLMSFVVSWDISSFLFNVGHDCAAAPAFGLSCYDLLVNLVWMLVLYLYSGAKACFEETRGTVFFFALHKFWQG
jgi:hypothetical protein